MTQQADSCQRRYDLDWLRVIAFGLLIFYHIGMFYVTWDWHVKSPYAGATLELPMMLLNPWRLSLLFFISGVAIRFASDKSPLLQYAGSRSFRIGIPIVFGMCVLVMPQTWFELRQAGLVDDTFAGFYQNYLSLDQVYPVTTPTWNHLWYIVYLLVYTLILVLLVPFFRLAKTPLAQFIRLISGGEKAAWRLLLIPAIPFLIYRFSLTPHFPTTHALTDDWANHAISFSFFLLGYLIAKNDDFWLAVRKSLRPTVIIVVLSVPVLGYFWVNWDSLVPDTAFINVLRAWRVLYAWWVIVLLLGLAQRFLNRPSPVLTYMTGSVFSWYILHQTIIVAAGYYLAQRQLGGITEFALVLIITVSGCLIITELVRHIPVLRLVLGLKGRRNSALTPVSSVPCPPASSPGGA